MPKDKYGNVAYASDAQRRYMHARHPNIAARWDAEIREQRSHQHNMRRRKIAKAGISPWMKPATKAGKKATRTYLRQGSTRFERAQRKVGNVYSTVTTRRAMSPSGGRIGERLKPGVYDTDQTSQHLVSGYTGLVAGIPVGGAVGYGLTKPKKKVSKAYRITELGSPLLRAEKRRWPGLKKTTFGAAGAVTATPVAVSWLKDPNRESRLKRKKTTMSGVSKLDYDQKKSFKSQNIAYKNKEARKAVGRDIRNRNAYVSPRGTNRAQNWKTYGSHVGGGAGLGTLAGAALGGRRGAAYGGFGGALAGDLSGTIRNTNRAVRGGVEQGIKESNVRRAKKGKKIGLFSGLEKYDGASAFGIYHG